VRIFIIKQIYIIQHVTQFSLPANSFIKCNQLNQSLTKTRINSRLDCTGLVSRSVHWEGSQGRGYRSRRLTHRLR